MLIWVWAAMGLEGERNSSQTAGPTGKDRKPFSYSLWMILGTFLLLWLLCCVIGPLTFRNQTASPDSVYTNDAEQAMSSLLSLGWWARVSMRQIWWATGWLQMCPRAFNSSENRDCENMYFPGKMPGMRKPKLPVQVFSTPLRQVRCPCPVKSISTHRGRSRYNCKVNALNVYRLQFKWKYTKITT